MPETDSPSPLVLESLGYAVFACGAAGALRLAGPAPAWLTRLWPAAAAVDFALAGVSPFLENFLVDAAECWKAGGTRRVRSGPWIETEATGAEVRLEATAMNAGGRALLLVQWLGGDYDTRQALLQKARETTIAYQRLNSEIQKKEILLHCVAADMSQALANTITALRLIELEKNAPRTTELLALAQRGAHEQQSLIGKVLDVFKDDLGGIYGRHGDGGNGADFDTAIRDAVGATELQFSEKGVRLSVPVPATQPLTIATDAPHLERVVANLLENALLHTPPGGAISVSLDPEADAVVLKIEDNGEGMPPDVCDKLVSKFEPAVAPSHDAFLRLHFCRIAVEGCRGEMGYTPLPAGGNCFWVRLPRGAET